MRVYSSSSLLLKKKNPKTVSPRKQEVRYSKDFLFLKLDWIRLFSGSFKDHVFKT